MDYDLEIISEEGDGPDPLFNSIISAMNSMKEATADKIYQKIQRDGATNYSKPQVDRALASALKYGIFEIKNNRYRVRDNILDDVDTVYWKMQKKREQTPFRIQEDINERQLGPKLDPEKDNLRFRKISNSEVSECPQCGRVKKQSSDKKEHDKKVKRSQKEKKKSGSKRLSKDASGKKKCSTKKRTKQREEKPDENSKPNESKNKRKIRSHSLHEEKRTKLRRLDGFETKLSKIKDTKYFRDGAFMKPRKDPMPGGGKYDSTDESELDSLSLLSDDEQSFTSYQVKPRDKSQKRDKICRFDSEGDDVIILKGNNKRSERTRSYISFQSESDSEVTSVSNEPSKYEIMDSNFYDSLPCTSTNLKVKEKNQFFCPTKIYERDDPDDCDKKSDWIGYPGDPQGTIIESNNVLTIEPMDSMAFKGSEPTSYIS